MDTEAIEAAVMAYLRRKGYKHTEQAFRGEAKTQALEEMAKGMQADIDSSITNQIYFYDRVCNSDSVAARYREAYGRLRSWVHSSLDLYKNELLRILYPVFVHSFLELVSKGHLNESRQFFSMFREEHEQLHVHDLQKLEGISSPQHLQENELARTFLDNKISTRLCQYSFELLLRFLHGAGLMLMLAIVNEHVNLQVFPGQPSPTAEDEEATVVTGKASQVVKQLNLKEIQWGALEDSVEHKFEKEMAAAEAEKLEADVKEGEGDDGKKRTGEGGKAATANKKAKKEKVPGGTTGKGRKTDTGKGTGWLRTQAVIPLPTVSEEAEKEVLEDLRRRIRLSAQALPSVCFYTVTNAHSSLNCVALSPDGSLVAGGFADSSVKLWDMAKAGSSQQLSASETGNSEPLSGNRMLKGGEALQPDGGPSYELLRAHAGPVFSTHFSPDSRYLLSSSADCTVRLWSMEMKANLACYKGHNYPVWDCQFSPVGHYFASASHDRTARIWSMDRIQPLRIMAGHLADVDCVRWHVNCNYIATGSSDKTVRLWDVQTGECVRMFAGHRGTVLTLALSPDGRYMASGDEDGAIMLWDLGSGRRVTPLLGHTGCVWSLAFSGEAALLASGSADNTVRLWDVSASTKATKTEEKGGTGVGRRLRLVKTLPTKATPVYSLQFTRRNLLLAAGAINLPRVLVPNSKLQKT